jgi:hypothetical protein
MHHDHVTAWCLMLSFLKRRYPDLRLVRMSDGTWSLIRDLGPVKGGKGLRCHERVFSFRVQVKLTPALKWNVRVPLPGIVSQAFA